MIQKNRPQHKQQGFTLLEMLLAFSMVSLLFLALFSSFHTVSRSWEAAEKRIEKTEDMRLITGWLRRQLQQMLVLRITGEQNGGASTVYAFEGENDRVRFAAPLQPFQDKGGVYLIELFVGKGDGGKTLEMRYAPYRPDLSWEDAFDGIEPVLVYEGFKKAKFEYLVAENIDDEPEWENEWLEQPTYPLLLKISLETSNKEVWPETIIYLPQVDEYLNVDAAQKNNRARHHLTPR